MKISNVLYLVDKYSEANDRIADEEGIPACIREYVHDVLEGFREYVQEIDDLTNIQSVL